MLSETTTGDNETVYTGRTDGHFAVGGPALQDGLPVWHAFCHCGWSTGKRREAWGGIGAADAAVKAAMVEHLTGTGEERRG